MPMSWFEQMEHDDVAEAGGMTTNEAAERLRVYVKTADPEADAESVLVVFDAALAEERRQQREAWAKALADERAEERRHVIEQIRERIMAGHIKIDGPRGMIFYFAHELDAILDDLSTPEQKR